MRAEDVYIEDGKREDTGKLSSYLDVRPMSSHLDLRHTQADLSVHNAIKFDRERLLLLFYVCISSIRLCFLLSSTLDFVELFFTLLV